MFLPCISVGAAESQSANTLELVLRPTHVYKTPDRSHENTESWIFSIMAQVGVPSKLSPAGMKVTLLSQTNVVRTVSYPAEGVKALTYHPRLGPKLPDGTDPKSPIFWPFAIRLRQTEPVGLGVDAMRIEIDAVEDEGGQHRNATVDVSIETYHQKCSLMFPFVGKGIILQGGATNGGHRNRSGAFAIDACGLDEAWSIVAPGPGKQNADYRGWGREIIAPADGVVVRVRNDRPDQPVADVSDPKYYAPEYKDGGDVGNYLVIDHGSSEYSMMAHFQEGSILVKVGDRVHRGQALGKLGHSGDTDGPHLHYQLQAGPDWENADALPCKFTNVDQALLDRGTYFEAK